MAANCSGESRGGRSFEQPAKCATVEMKTGSRRIIGYLLSPLARYEHDVLRER